MKRYFRFANDPKRFKPLVTSDMGVIYRYWTVTTTTLHGQRLIQCFATFEEAIAQANTWADEYRAAWVERNMRFQETGTWGEAA